MPPQQDDKSSGISLQTLLISSLSAVAAAVIVPLFWERGSLIATAVTPIVVALVSEALSRPAKVIKTTASQRVTRRTGTGAAMRVEQPTGVGARGEGPERVTKWGDADDPFGLRSAAAPPRRRRRGWRLAIGTGLLAAVIGAAAVTASELAIFGHSVVHRDRSTSVFGGRRDPTPTPSATASPSTQPTATATATPRASETPTPETTATPGASAAPSASAQAPLQATPTEPAPTAGETPVPTP